MERMKHTGDLMKKTLAFLMGAAGVLAGAAAQGAHALSAMLRHTKKRTAARQDKKIQELSWGISAVALLLGVASIIMSIFTIYCKKTR